MAAAGESTCHSDPNFAVICSFLDKYGELLGLPEISYVDLQEYLEDTKTGLCWWFRASSYFFRLHRELGLS